MASARHLVLFAKAPRIGRVKTRLAGDIGAVAAWTVYRRMLNRMTLRLSCDGRWNCWLAVTPDDAVHAGRLWPEGFSLVSQGGGDLGRRMARVAGVLPPGPVVIVGADVPGIGRAHIAAAFKALGRADAVFGPATDGGFWLAGLRRRIMLANIFEGVRWSTEHALADTLTNARGRYTTAFLDTLDDIDDGADYARWQEINRRGLP